MLIIARGNGKLALTLLGYFESELKEADAKYGEVSRAIADELCLSETERLWLLVKLGIAMRRHDRREPTNHARLRGESFDTIVFDEVGRWRTDTETQTSQADRSDRTPCQEG